MSHGGGGTVTVNVTSCPPPFIDATLFPPYGGEISARFCAKPTPSLDCCLPCPLTYWVFSDKIDTQAPAANWVGMVGFILNSLLLLTYLVLPEEKSHRHYLSIGLTTSLLLLSIAFLIPLSTHPEECFNEITPNNMHSDLSCAWTGALVLAGAMGAVVWILLRSIWTALRIVFDFKRTDIFKYISLTLGIGLPALFLAVAMPETGVSYRLHNVCLPNGEKAFISWFIWLIVFATLSAIILVMTVLYCLWKFAISALAGARGGSGHVSGRSTDTDASAEFANETPKQGKARRRKAIRRQRRVEWGRIQRVLYLQWRTIVLAFIVVNETIFFGLVFVQETGAVEAASNGITPGDLAWGECLIETGGDKNKCLNLSGGLGLSEPRVLATLLLASLLGPVIFLLMLRWSMLEGWYEILRNPRQILQNFNHRRPSVGSQDFIMQTGSPKHISLQKPLGSEIPPPLQSPGTATRAALGLDSHTAGDEHEKFGRGGSVDEEDDDDMEVIEMDDEEKQAVKAREEDEILV